MIFSVAGLLFIVAAVLGGHALFRRLDPAAEWPTRLGASWLLGQAVVSAGAVFAVAVGWPLELALLPPLVFGLVDLAGSHGPWRRPLRLRKTVPTARAGASPAPTAETDSRGDRSRGWRRLLGSITTRNRFADLDRDARANADPLLRGLALLAGLLALAFVWRSPGLGWDGQAIWGLKARLLAETGRLPLDVLEHPASISMHPEYPLHVPLLGGVLGSLASLLGGAWPDRALPLLTAVDLLAIALLLVGVFERDGGRRSWRRLLLAGGLLTPIVWRELAEGKADLTLALCLLASTLGLVRWLRSGRVAWAYLAAIAAGLGAFTKQEGAVWLVLAFAVAAWLSGWLSGWPSERRRRRRELVGPLLLALAIALPWHLFRFAVGLRTEPFALSMAQLERLPAVAEAMLLAFADYGHWGVLWLAVWPAIVVLDVRRFSASRRRTATPDLHADLLPSRLLVAGLAAIGLIFLATPHDLQWHLSTALDRLLLQWWPVALLAIDAALPSQRWQPGQ